MDERSFLTADKGAGAQIDFNVEIESAAKKVLTQKAHFSGLADGNLKTLDRQWVLCTDVDDASVGAYDVPAYGHGFKHGMRIALQNGTVHERAWVTLVRVTNNVFLIPRGSHCEFPLHAGGETTAAPATKTGVLDNLDRFLPWHGENAGESLIPSKRYVFHDVLRIDHPAVSEGDTELLFIEWHVPVEIQFLILNWLDI